jgi:acetyl-CoA synthetase
MSRLWRVVAAHGVTQFYTAPTVVRALARAGEAPVRAADVSSLRVIASVGEPINPEAWRWYFR